MRVFALFDDSGRPVGFWHEGIHAPGKIPDDAIQITTQQWKAFTDNAGQRCWKDGHVVTYKPGDDILIGSMLFERNARLDKCDWVVLRSLETGEPVPQEWLTYRQALRDLPESTDPLWPEAPTI